MYLTCDMIVEELGPHGRRIGAARELAKEWNAESAA